MNIVVASALEASSHWAHAINSVKMAEGFASLGHRVTLVCRRPPKGRVDERELREGYGLAQPLRWIQLPARLGRRSLGDRGAFSLLALLAALPARPDLVYARNYVLPWLTSLCGIPTVVESHAHPDNDSPPFLRLARAARRPSLRLWVTISQHLAQHYRSLGVPGEKLLVLPDAVDLRMFARPRALPPSPYRGERPAAVYVGHLYDYKGIPTLLDAAARLPEVQFHLVGGWPEDVARQAESVRSRELKNVTLHGPVRHAAIAPYLWHADVLLLPPSARHPSAAWTSPLKLGEYLASGTPVVATAIPALRDQVTPDEVHFVEPDCGRALAAGIEGVLARPGPAAFRARSGAARAAELSYARRARAVLERLGGVGADARVGPGRSPVGSRRGRP